MFPTISIASLLNKGGKYIPFLVDRIEEMEEPENLVYPHKHNFYEILWITKGNSSQKIDYQAYKIAAGTLFFISPGQLHLFEEWQNIEGYCILFNEDFFLQLFQNKNILFELSYLDNLYSNPFLKITEQDKDKLQPIVDLLYKEQSTETVQALLFVLLKQIQNLVLTHDTVGKTKHQIVIFKQFKALVNEHFANNLSITDYASKLNITAHHLNTIVKLVCQKKASDIINERIVLEAKLLLQFSDDTISQTSYKLGFEDSSYFARYFKKHTKTSPADFRKQNLR